MIIENEKKCIPSLKKLWKEVFKDEDELVDLFFENEYKYCKTFAVIKNNEVVSAFYLLNSKLKYEDKIYKGFYLYAASTKENERKKGHITALMKEAFAFAKKNNYDYISLVPSEESLYNYYSRFGFENLSYRYVTNFEEQIIEK